MRTSNKSIMVVLGVGAVLGLAGQALAQGGHSRGRDGFRGGSNGRSSYVNRGHSGSYRESNRRFTPPRIVDSRRSFRGSFSGRSQYGHSGFSSGSISGGFGRGFATSNRQFAAPRIIAAPRVITPGWTSYGYPVYTAPTCGVSRPVFAAPSYRHHQYVRPTWRHHWR